MKAVTEKLIKQHQHYSSDNPSELKDYGSIYDHMLYYFTSVLGIDEQQALYTIQDFKSDLSCDVLKNIVQSKVNL
ncbi:hypothetical protein HZF08_37325 [Paenibacillus sp. CGMCC 1.16610]|uniref:Uncharacterized protein n=1 Tax=Paenibacillus anseongense TaxID=2682845 RepID=A0ABW9UHD2_9BACL|nr:MULTISPECIES: hypothetical protein [Paenibacillus]MBA2943936.1 hypothetical protein [Paenibacillus sp. CGMCC 1.16610]MVQ37825.1 hypothetical protein [Paenibacillus anseongense]